MRHIRYSENIDTYNQRLPFFLATEEWAARFLPADDWFFSWQVSPTVICGRNQEIDKEVDLEYCRRNGIDVVRRRSGGGAVFADRDNFMFSLITAGDNVTETFARYTSLIANALRAIGINAEATGRNDINIDGRKVAGNAFYHLPGRCIAHGTMLYDFDPSHIAGALTPSKAKMESKGVKSVPSRITCLKKENISLSPADFELYMIEHITEGDPYIVSDEDYRKIKAIEEGYYEPSFMRIQNKSARSGSAVNSDGHRHVCRMARLEGLGEFCVEYEIDRDARVMTGFRISGDFFMSSDVDEMICRRLDGTPHEPHALSERLDSIHPECVIPGLSSHSLASLILS